MDRNLGDFTERTLNYYFPNSLTSVCDGGTFTVFGSQLISKPKDQNDSSAERSPTAMCAKKFESQ